MNHEFDRKLGADFISAVPHECGVYIFRGEMGEPIYVGKAKSLRRRLSQYRLASQKKAFRKMRLIVKEAVSLDFQICETEKEALLLENRLILQHKPKLNIAGAFSFLYPYLGFKWEASKPRELALCYTTSPAILTGLGFELFGAFRSRASAAEAYEALSYAFTFLGHHTPALRKQYGDIPYTRIICFRQLEGDWHRNLRAFFRGEAQECLGRLVEELLEKPDARQLAADIQSHLKCLKAFYRSEAVKLRTALASRGFSESSIAQEERDQLFLSID